MTKTFQNCSFSEPFISPKNWNTKRKDILNKNWFVQCYFFDPLYKDKYPRGFPYRKKINKLHDLDDRIAAAKFLLDAIPQLFISGYNPISKEYMYADISESSNLEITEHSPFLDALNWAFSNITVSNTTKNDIKYILKAFSISLLALRLDKIAIGTVRKRQIRFVIDDIQKRDGLFSAHKFNKYRDHLSILFKELCEYDAVETNIVLGISKKKTIKNIREVLNEDERIAVNAHLKENHFRFWLFTILFFHSGARITELLDLKVKDVNLEKGTFRILVKKGKEHTYIDKVMKEISLDHWSKAIIGGKKDDYIFSVGLIPGEQRIRIEQIQRRWRTHVKQKLGITADFYALKHLNLDDISRLYSINDAASAAGHTSTRMVTTHYAVGEKERQDEKLRKMPNTFA